MGNRFAANPQSVFMSVRIIEVVDALERFAPLPLEESYDNAGLQIGLTEAEVSGALLCLDVTESVIDEAIRKGCNMIVAHHPLIFRKLAHITGQTYVERCVTKAIKNDIVIVAMHTNLDAVEGGVNHQIAERLNLQNVRFFGRQQTVDERNGGNGVIGDLQKSVEAREFIQQLKDIFHVKCVQTNELLKYPIRSVAVCGGAGSFLIDDAVREGADAFITGEVGYHQFFGNEQMIQIIALGHYQSEQYTTEVLRRIIAPLGVRCEISDINTNPILYL